ncbi:MAG: CSLREA domain-containing protein, partial [Anaerolineales bacterium]|nr:CSLREA domain-containing protein [Anaerolineales bacterium]
MVTAEFPLKQVRKSVLLLFILALGLLAGIASDVARAAGFTVNSTADAVDALPGDGICATSGGVCTLRAAIQEANATPGADTVSLPIGTYTLSIAGNDDSAAAGDLDVTQNLTLEGAGAALSIIDAAGLDRALHVLPGVTLNLYRLKIQNGLANPGGGMLLDGSAWMREVSFSNNQAPETSTAGNGGAIFAASASSSLTILISQFDNNSAYFGGGAISTTTGSTLSVTDSTFTGNDSALGGGAIYPNGSATTISSSTFDGNSSGVGGAVHSNSTAVSITNSTFVNNTAVNGGAVDARSGTITINNSTFSANSASGTGDSLTSQPGQGGVLQVRNSILAGASANNCDAVTDLGSNLSWPDANNCPGTQADPLLGPLADNGGWTHTLALPLGSPALDAGDNATCDAKDQRAYARPQGPACDIGAFERLVAMVTPTPTGTAIPIPTATPGADTPQSGPTFTVNVAADANDGTCGTAHCSLREAIIAANAQFGGNAIHFDIPGVGPHAIQPIVALPDVTDPLTIDGLTQPGAGCAAWPPTLQIELDGSNTSLANGLYFGFGAAGSTVRGLVVNRFYVGI